MSIGERIKSIRKAQGWTQKELAKLAGLSASAITYYEKGQRIPSIIALQKIANALRVSITEISPDNFEKKAAATEMSFNNKQLDIFIELFSNYMKYNKISITEISDARLMILFSNFLLDLNRDPVNGITIIEER